MSTFDLTQTTPTKLQTGDIINVPYSGSAKSLTLPKGIYKLEVWGAQGGSYSTYYGGKGGYSYGTLTLVENALLYCYVGGQPATNSTDRVVVSGGFNGGGNGYNRYYSNTYTYGQGGGGASDIRVASDSLYARIIVAGGGGGSASADAQTTKYGGGLSSGSPQSEYSASQTGAGTNGSFGVGGSVTTSGNNYKYSSGGGGGGWYGGGACTSYSDSSSGLRGYNGGGSGYVYTSSTASNYPSGCLLNSAYYLTDAATIGGNESIPDSTTGSNVTGNSGNGYIRITVIKIESINMKVKVDKRIVDDSTVTFFLNGESLSDASQNGNIISASNGVVLSNEQSKFGGKSLYFDGNSYLETSLPSEGDVTIDFWMYFTEYGSTYPTPFNYVSGTTRGMYLHAMTDTTVFASASSSAFNSTNSDVLTTGAWIHIAFVRVGTDTNFYVNGALKTTVSGCLTTNDRMVLGNLVSSASNTQYKGYIDYFRVSNIARWTSDFDVPTEESYGSMMFADTPSWKFVKKSFIKTNTGWKPITSVYVKTTNGWKKSG